MLAGEQYQVDDELRGLSLAARALCAEINANAPDEAPHHAELLKRLLGSFGEDSVLRPPLCCDYGKHTQIGRGVFINFDCVFLDCAEIRIGDHVQIATRVQLLTATHPLAAEPRRLGWESAAPITLQDNVWLGGGVIVCPGVTIGENSVIGAGSVVTQNIPPNVVAVGNPCRVLRPLPTEATRSPKKID
jgi:maltose O-acetyltransferase